MTNVTVEIEIMHHECGQKFLCGWAQVFLIFGENRKNDYILMKAVVANVNGVSYIKEERQP